MTDIPSQAISEPLLKPEEAAEVLSISPRFRRTGNGLTDKELEQPPEFRECEYSTAHKRLTDLMQKGYVIDSGEKRDGLTVWNPVLMDHLATRLQAESRGEKPLF